MSGSTIRRSDFVVTGHRGAMAIEPENTMRSFRRAEELAADELELDVHLSSDQHLVVMHDHTLDRTTNGSGAIADTTWAEIRALDAGLGEQVPELAEVWTAFWDLSLQVEVKDAAATVAVLELIKANPRPGGTIITSFHPEAVATAMAAAGPWRVGLIGGEGGAEMLTQHAGSGVDMLMVHWSLVDLPAVRTFRERGGQATVWPCNDRESVLRAIDEGWSGTTVDDPAMGVAARNERLAPTD